MINLIIAIHATEQSFSWKQVTRVKLALTSVQHEP